MLKLRVMTISDSTVVALEDNSNEEKKIAGFSLNNNFQFSHEQKEGLTKFFSEAFVKEDLTVTITAIGVDLISSDVDLGLHQCITSVIFGDDDSCEPLSFTLDRCDIKKIASLFV